MGIGTKILEVSSSQTWKKVGSRDPEEHLP